MLGRCFFCYRPFPLNGSLEGLALGRRVAFDPERGRLWLVCASCGRWTLVPIEERWEVLEALERMVAGARVLGRTDHMALLSVRDLEIVRIGRADLREETRWRYGPEFAARRARADRLDRLGEAADGVLTTSLFLFSLAFGGWPLVADTDPDKWLRWVRRRRFGRYVWRGAPACPRCGKALPDRGFEERGSLLVEVREGGGLGVWWPCPECGSARDDGGHRLAGLAAEHVLRRLLAWENFAGGSPETMHHALDLVERAGSAAGLVAGSSGALAIGRVPARVTLALEIALSTEAERRLLAMELGALERRWRREEEIAAIVDGELTPIPVAPPPVALTSVSRSRPGETPMR